jgi:hypothetical protein
MQFFDDSQDVLNLRRVTDQAKFSGRALESGLGLHGKLTPL